MDDSNFEWSEIKNLSNIKKHGVSFYDAQFAFLDENRVAAIDINHSQKENRFYCFGFNKEHTGILTVRFTYRNRRMRIIGAGYWRKGKKIYEQANPIH